MEAYVPTATGFSILPAGMASKLGGICGSRVVGRLGGRAEEAREACVIQMLAEVKGVTSSYAKSIKRTLNHDHMIQDGAKQWLATIGSTVIEDHIVYKEFDAEAAETLDELKSYLDNTDYQRDDCLQACQRLGISYCGMDHFTFRVGGMARNRKLYSWQPTAVK